MVSRGGPMTGVGSVARVSSRCGCIYCLCSHSGCMCVRVKRERGLSMKTQYEEMAQGMSLLANELVDFRTRARPAVLMRRGSNMALSAAGRRARVLI